MKSTRWIVLSLARSPSLLPVAAIHRMNSTFPGRNTRKPIFVSALAPKPPMAGV